MAICKKCKSDYSDARRALGYQTCLFCGSDKKFFTIAPSYNKGPYQVITKKNIKDIGK